MILIRIQYIILSLWSALLLTGCFHREEAKPVPSSPIEQPKPDTSAPPSITTGLPLAKETNPFAVMIENSSPSRPHSGLSSADIVYEMQVEYHITRFMALFNTANLPKRIGPVRSARHYYIPIAEEYNIPYIHYGRSSLAYYRLEKATVPHIDGITEEKYFSRDSSRKAPHNAYLHPNRLSEYKTILQNKHFRFGDQPYVSYPDVTAFEFTYNSFTHVKYIYDTETKTYQRFLAEKPHVDLENDKQIAPQNVIIQYAKHRDLHDAKAHIDITLVGTGPATYYSNGKKITGFWKKENESKSTQFFDKDGNILILQPGKTWIQVVEEHMKITES